MSKLTLNQIAVASAIINAVAESTENSVMTVTEIIVALDKANEGAKVEAPAPVATPVATATATPTPVAEAPAPTYRKLEYHEIVAAGDQWKLRDGVRTRHPERKEWQVVTDSVGREVGDFEKSEFRRLV